MTDAPRTAASRARYFKPAALLLALILGHLFISLAQAQTGLKIQLVSETTAIVPGQPFYLGLYIQHEPGYHTYWRQPGIVGVPTTMKWKLPDGFKAGPLEYPEPEATMMFQIKAQGYERDRLLQPKITPPAALQEGDTVTLTGTASWMCCGRTCHPGVKDLEITLPVAAKASLNAQWHPLFEKERAAFAHPTEAWVASAKENGLDVTVTLTPNSDQARRFSDSAEAKRVLFFTEDGWINSDEPQQMILQPDGSLVLKLRRAEVFLGNQVPDRLLGVVQRQGGWLAGGGLRSMSIAPALRR